MSGRPYGWLDSRIPHGTDFSERVREVLAIGRPGSGFVICRTRTFTDDVPLATIVAMNRELGADPEDQAPNGRSRRMARFIIQPLCGTIV
jgi:hypothetical protein